MPTLLDNLRRHPEWRAGERLVIIVVRQILNQHRRAKVGQLAPAVIVGQHVCALDVAMHNLVRVQVLEAAQNLKRVLLGHRLRECAVFLQQRRERAARHVLEELGASTKRKNQCAKS